MVVAGVNHAGVNHAGVNDAGSAVTTPDTRPADGDNDELDITVDFTDAAIRGAVEAAPDGILVIEADGNIVVANPMACELFGYSRHDLVGANVDLLLPDGLRAGHAAHRASYLARPRTRPMGSGLDLRGHKRSGVEFPVEISLSPVRAAERPLVVAIVRDVTERRRAAEDLMAAHEELALVGDRERIARDLHDTVIQRLFAVGLALQGVLAREHNPEIANRVEAAIDEIDGTIRDVRTAVFALHARRAATAGPRDDVLATTREAARALGFDPQVQFEGLIDATMPAAVHDQLLPTLREALSNITKHAHATSASVMLVVDDDSVRLRVTDNGVGLGDQPSGGRGLGNMVERAEELGGTCTVTPGRPRGTVVEWSVPLR